jgi:hypothetical protein
VADLKRSAKMKRSVAIMSFGVLLSGCATEPAFVVRAPSPEARFSLQQVTPIQFTLCEAFKVHAGDFRKPELEALLQAGAIPFEKARVVRDDIVTLLGRPDSEDRKSLSYSLGFSHGRGSSCSFLVADGRVVGLSFAETL